MNEGMYYDDAADRIEEAQRRYFQSDKGKASQKRYAQSEKGKQTLSKVQREYYLRKKAQKLFAEACAKYLAENPGKTPNDFIKSLESDTSNI